MMPFFRKDRHRGSTVHQQLAAEPRCESLLLKSPFQAAPKGREDPAAEAAGAKDAEGGGGGVVVEIIFNSGFFTESMALAQY